jgi:hypothetical protein
MFGMTAVSFAAEGAWTRKTDMPTKRFGISIADVDGKLFVIGGSQANEGPLPVASGDFGFAGLNGKIYVFGGATAETYTRPPVSMTR